VLRPLSLDGTTLCADGSGPATGTALAAVCTRRFRAQDPFVATADALLAEDRPDPPGADGTWRAGAGQP
jgi:hypothetical protein